MKFIKSEQAISETIGFIIILCIVMTSIGLITVYGYPILENAIENTQFESTEQGFLVLQSNIKMVALGQSPIKMIKLGLGDGALTADSTRGRIRVDEDNDGSYDIDITPGVIEYEKSNKKIAYENGGVFKSYSVGGTVELSEPRIYVREVNGSTFVSVSIINISGDLSSVGGGVSSVVVEYYNLTSPSINSSNTVTIEVTSDYADSWGRYFEEKINATAGDTVVTAGGTTTATIAYDKLLVNEYIINATVK